MDIAVSPRIRFGAFEFNTASGELTRNGTRRALRPQAARILAFLAFSEGRVVSREDLREQVWGTDIYVDFEHSLNLCIHEIRAALHDDASRPTYIETLPRRGYRFIAAIETREHPPENHAVQALVEDANVLDRSQHQLAQLKALALPESRDGNSEPRRALRGLVIFAAAAVVIAIGAITYVRFGIRKPDRVETLPPRVETLAVLPFTDIANRPGEDYFTDGVTYELVNQLGRNPSLRVTSLWSVMPFKNSKEPISQIAQQLNVSRIMSGTVVRIGERARINVKLVDPGSRSALWAQSYEVDLADLPQAEEDVAEAVANELASSTLRRADADARHRLPVNVAAHEAFLKAISASTSEEYWKGLRHSVELDPDFGLAWSEMASSYVGRAWFSQDQPPMADYAKARECALRALAIDETDSSAHVTIAAVKLHNEWDWAGAEREFKRAIQLNPSDAQAHHIYAHYLLTMDRLRDSVAESRKASDLDPLDPGMSTCVGWHCLYARQYDDAVTECLRLVKDEKAVPLTYYYLGRVYVRQGKLDEAIAALQLAATKSGGLNSVLATLGYAEGLAGRRADVAKVLGVLDGRAKKGYVSALDYAVVYAGLGDADKTFEWLDRACLERSTWVVHLKWDERFVGVRSDPRFAAILRRIGVPNPDSVRGPETPGTARYVGKIASTR